jgi:hypothetical protein
VAAAFIGRLPTTEADILLVKILGISIFLLSFVPLIFGGKIYNTLERAKKLGAMLLVTTGVDGLTNSPSDT